MKDDGTLEVGDLVISQQRVCRVGTVNASRARVDPITPALRGRNDFDSWDISPRAIVDPAEDYEFDSADTDRLVALLERAEFQEILDEERRLVVENRRIERSEAERVAALHNTPAHSAEFEEEGTAMAVAGVPVGSPSATLKAKNAARLAALQEKKEAAKAAAKAAKTPGANGKERAPKAPKELKACFCGCGETTGGYFVPGHDARFKGWLLKIEKGDEKKENLLQPAVIAKYKWVPSGMEGKAGKGQRPTMNYKGEPHSGYARPEDV